MSCLAQLVSKAKADINQAVDLITLDNIRIEYFGKKGHFSRQIATLRKLSPEERPAFGAILNKSKCQVQQALNERQVELEDAILNARLVTETIDVSLPGRRVNNGNLHPITATIDRVEDFFSTFGFTIENGPEIEDVYHNFDALNIPNHHPARANHDTFWFDANRLLRTQTSGIQIRIMQVQQPPIRIISSGRVYRNDYDKNHTPMFHQMEGLVVDKNISFTNLKSTLHDFLFNFFGEKIQIRFRPSYFPFTVLSVEIDIMDKHNKWLEILGCGMIHPDVLKNVDINPDIYSGFAFGIGIERLTMLHYNITDLRVFFENDLRFLKQFK